MSKLGQKQIKALKEKMKIESQKRKLLKSQIKTLRAEQKYHEKYAELIGREVTSTVELMDAEEQSIEDELDYAIHELTRTESSEDK